MKFARYLSFLRKCQQQQQEEEEEEEELKVPIDLQASPQVKISKFRLAGAINSGHPLF